MPLTRFVPSKPYLVTIRVDGRFAFSASLSRRLEDLHVRRLTLFGDDTTKQVRMTPAKADDTGAKLVTIAHPDNRPRATIEGYDFLRRLGYTQDRSIRYLVTERDHSFSFVADPSTAIGTHQPTSDLSL